VVFSTNKNDSHDKQVKGAKYHTPNPKPQCNLPAQIEQVQDKLL
jgi:hypothetical protein